MVSEVNRSFSTGSTVSIGSKRAVQVARRWMARTSPAMAPEKWFNMTGTRSRRTQPSQPASAEPTLHVPVLLRQAIDYLAPRDGGVYIDGTFGAGGYAAAVLGAADARVIGIDRDANAIAGGRAQVEASGGRLTLVEGRFAALDAIASGLGIAAADGIVLDLGVSSMQLDTPERGFSFRHDGPLDMRMGRDGPSAADILAVV